LLPRDNSADAQDECRRVRFAPSDRILSDDYLTSGDDDAARLFFKACRQQMYAPVEKLAAWGIDATEDDQRRAFLDYVLSGDQAIPLSHVIRSRMQDQDTWLEELSHESIYLQHLSESEKVRVLGGSVGSC